MLPLWVIPIAFGATVYIVLLVTTRGRRPFDNLAARVALVAVGIIVLAIAIWVYLY